MEDLSFVNAECKQLSIDFTLQYIELLKKQKYLKNEIKSVRKKFNELGLPTRTVMRAYKEFEREKKEDKNERMNIETFKDMLLESRDVQDAFTELEDE